jgi:hypothetical protein
MDLTWLNFGQRCMSTTARKSPKHCCAKLSSPLTDWLGLAELVLITRALEEHIHSANSWTYIRGSQSGFGRPILTLLQTSILASILGSESVFLLWRSSSLRIGHESASESAPPLNSLSSGHMCCSFVTILTNSWAKLSCFGWFTKYFWNLFTNIAPVVVQQCKIVRLFIITFQTSSWAGKTWSNY